MIIKNNIHYDDLSIEKGDLLITKEDYYYLIVTRVTKGLNGQNQKDKCFTAVNLNNNIIVLDTWDTIAELVSYFSKKHGVAEVVKSYDLKLTIGEDKCQK